MEYNDSYFEIIKALGTKKQVKKHVCLYNRAYIDKYVYCLDEGLCALHSVSPGGKERIYQYFLPGDFIAFTPAFSRIYPDETFYAFSITTKSVCTLHQIPYTVFRAFTEENPDVYRWLFETTMNHYDNALKHCYALQDGNNFISLCHALIEFTVCQDSRYALHKDFSYSELANYLGIHTITVTRMIAKLKAMGIIRKDGHLTVICDMEALRALTH